MAHAINKPRVCWNCNKVTIDPETYKATACTKFPKRYVYDDMPGCSCHAYNTQVISDKTGDPELDAETDIIRRDLTNHRNRWYQRYRNRQDTALTQDEMDWNDE